MARHVKRGDQVIVTSGIEQDMPQRGLVQVVDGPLHRVRITQEVASCSPGATLRASVYPWLHYRYAARTLVRVGARAHTRLLSTLGILQ